MKLNEHLTRITTLLKRRRSGAYINPVRDWTIGLFVATLVFIAGVSLIGADFYIQFYTDHEVAPTQTRALTYHATDIQALADTFAHRKEVFDSLRKSNTYMPPTPPPAIISSTSTDSQTAEPTTQNKSLADDENAQ